MFKVVQQSLVIIKTAWVRGLNYRFTVIMYRLGELAEILVLILMWTAIYSSGGGLIKGFSLNEMITYVLVGNICSMAVRNFLPSFVSRDIANGQLSMFLVKPMPYMQFVFLHEIGRAAFVTIFSVASVVLVIPFFFDKIIINHDPLYWCVIVPMIFFAFIIEGLLGFLIGTIAFWTDEVEAMQTSLDRVKRFFSGGYFPLSLLPATLTAVSVYLPFAYSFYVPAQLYLKKIDLHAGVIGLAIQVGWIIILSLILSVVWKRGLRRYEASGS